MKMNNVNENSVSEKIEIVAEINAKSEEDVPYKGLTMVSMVLGIVSLFLATLSVIGLIATLMMSIVIDILIGLSSVAPFVHMVSCIPIPILSIIAIVIASIAKKNGNNSTPRKLAAFFSWFALVASVLLIIGLAVLSFFSFVLDVVVFAVSFIFAFVISFVVEFIAALGAAIISFLTALSPALMPILTLLAGVVAIFGDTIIQEVFEALIYLFETYIINGAGVIFWM